MLRVLTKFSTGEGIGLFPRLALLGAPIRVVVRFEKRPLSGYSRD